MVGLIRRLRLSGRHGSRGQTCRRVEPAEHTGRTICAVEIHPTSSVFKEEECRGKHHYYGSQCVSTGLPESIKILRLYPNDWKIDSYLRLFANADTLARIKRGDQSRDRELMECIKDQSDERGPSFCCTSDLPGPDIGHHRLQRGDPISSLQATNNAGKHTFFCGHSATGTTKISLRHPNLAGEFHPLATLAALAKKLSSTKLKPWCLTAIFCRCL
jgi:hypothetical protein